MVSLLASVIALIASPLLVIWLAVSQFVLPPAALLAVFHARLLLLAPVASTLVFSPTPEALAMVAGVLISLVCSYVPGIANKFNSLDSDYQRLYMLLALFAATCGVFVLACLGVLQGVACTQPGLVDLVWAFVLAAIANQSTDRISPKIGLKAVKKLPITAAPASGVNIISATSTTFPEDELNKE